MRRTTFCLSCLVLAGTGLLIATRGASGGDADKCDRTEVVKFLREAVLGRTLAVQKMSFQWDGGKAEAEFESQTVYHDLAETAYGFSFEVTGVSTGRLYDLDKDGHRIQPGRPWQARRSPATRSASGPARRSSRGSAGSCPRPTRNPGRPARSGSSRG